MSEQLLDLTGTNAYAAYRLKRIFFGTPALILYVLLLVPFGWQLLSQNKVLPLLVAVLLLGVFVHIVGLFIKRKLENENEPPSRQNLATALSIGLIEHLASRKRVSIGDLVEASLRSPRGAFMIREMGIEAQTIRQSCREEIERTVDLLSFLEFALDSLSTFEEKRVDANVLLALLFRYMPCFVRLLQEADLSEDDLQGILKWEAFHHHFHSSESFWDPHVIAREGSLGRSWVMGYTDELDYLTTELGIHTPVGESSVMIHKKAAESVLSVLSRSALHNVLILGKVGVGKRTLIQNVAYMLRKMERERSLPFTRVLELHTEQLLSGVQKPDAFLLKAINRAKESGRFLLVIKDLSFLLKSADANLQTVFLRCLESSAISIVGIADTIDYHALIKNNPSVDSLFEKVTVDDASDEETMTVLMAHYFGLERRNVGVAYKAMKSILELSKRYLAGRSGFPGTAIQVMDDAVHRAEQQGHAYVRDTHVREVISLKGRVNVQKITEGEKERLMNLEQVLKKKIIGQDAAVRAVASALKRARLDISDRKRPIGTFLFIGPTGVGKTETAKALASEYFGSVDSIIRLDMNEFSHPDSIFGIIGSSSGGGGSEGFLAQRVQDKPFSLVLLDEMEKAHTTVLNLFLQILDEGFLTDSRGIRTDFRNTIIIATSNAGALALRDYMRDNPSYERTKLKGVLIDAILRERLFTPEFLNRFDDVVLFQPLDQESAMKVGNLMINDIVTDVARKRGITVVVAESLASALASKGYSVEFGAREMRRTITEAIEDYLADYMLRNPVKRGETITIRQEDVRL